MKRILVSGLISLLLCSSAIAQQVNVYTERQAVFLKDLFAEFSQRTGIKVETLYIDKGLVERIQSEGLATPADVVILTDAGRLAQLADLELVAKLDLPKISDQVPATLQDQNGYWVSLTKRVRMLFVNAKNTSPINSYEQLADPELGQGICLRSASHPYNNALIATYLVQHGEAKTADWLGGIKANLAREPQGNDRSQIHGVANGVCQIGIANNYYYFKMLNSKDSAERESASKVRPIVATIANREVPINITGIAITAAADNRQQAEALLKFMLSDYAQKVYAANNYELPVRVDTPLPTELAKVNIKIPPQQVAISKIISLRGAASKLAVQAGLAK